MTVQVNHKVLKLLCYFCLRILRPLLEAKVMRKRGSKHELFAIVRKCEDVPMAQTGHPGHTGEKIAAVLAFPIPRLPLPESLGGQRRGRLPEAAAAQGKGRGQSSPRDEQRGI